MKKTLLALSIAAMVTACGGDSDDPIILPNNKVSGTATAPGGTVSLHREQGIIEIVMDTLFESAHAEITGLQPVTGALVELIRIDDTGAQVGDVIAETTTSITGDYTLTLPSGVSLSGDLVVRITDGGAGEMRAQVVTRRLDVTPVSEFVLQSFIDSGADLDTLTTASVVKLTGQVDDFDLTAEANLADMIAALQEETGAFVDSAIDTITSEPGDASTIAGDYLLHTFQYGLHDNDSVEAQTATVATDIWTTAIALSDGGSGEVDATVSGEDSAYSNLTASGATPDYSLTFFSEVFADNETFSGPLSSDGVLAIESPFEEDIDGDFGWRFPPSITRFQKAPNDDIFFAVSEDAGVRYGTVDTNGDEIKDAVDPSDRQGDEVFRGLETLVKQPIAATNGSLSGDYGRVYLGNFKAASGQVEFEVERGKLNFDGAGLLDVGAQDREMVAQTGAGVVSYSSETLPAENDLSYSVSPNGDIPAIGGESADGMVSDAGTLIVFNEASATDDGNVEDDLYASVSYAYTLAVKLPTQTPTMQDRVYRVLSATAGFDGAAVLNRDIRFDTEVTFTSGVAASFTGSDSEVYLTSRTGSVNVTPESFAGEAATYTIGSDGAIEIVISDETGTRTMSGYMSEDASIGVLTDTWAATASDPTEVGLMILVELPQPVLP